MIKSFQRLDINVNIKASNQPLQLKDNEHSPYGRDSLEPVHNYLERQRSKSKLAKQNLASQYDSASLIKSGSVLRKIIATSESRQKLASMQSYSQKQAKNINFMDQLKAAGKKSNV